MIGFEPGFEARVVADEVRFNIPDYLLQAALDASYAAKDHTHTADQISGLEGALGGYLTKTEASSVYETQTANWTYNEAVDDANTRFPWIDLAGGKFRISWNALRAKYKTYFDGVYQIKGSYAAASHTHTISQITDLQAQLNAKITSDGRAYPRRVGGGAINFNWSGKGGTPTWVWGWKAEDGTEGQDMCVYQPGNFSVNYANSTWNSERLQGWDIAGIQNDAQNRANDRGYWATRDYLLAEHVPVGCTAFLKCQTSNSVGPGDSVVGSLLYWSNAGNQNGGVVNYGTWQCLGYTLNNHTNRTTLWKRVG
ncbi:hypothetical protein [Ochrobactrum sp. BTU1]|uniref:hypothetical protein n=1 Tax=Ochrobactrum sp. BTU1 TaxID=2840456 RepID=UPI001C057CCE|nr:hypothetical protein KMS41_05135 [Ochrobactrum sp. BTU1]